MRRGRTPAGRIGNPAPSKLSGWVIVLPGWGERCRALLADRVIPAVLHALHFADQGATLLIYSDVEFRLPELPAGVTAQFHPVPGPDFAFESLSNCHRDALTLIEPAARIMLLTADMVVSREVFATCNTHFNVGRRLICCIAPRTRQEVLPPIGATGRDLGAWAWEHRHRMTRECTWPDGHSFDIWRMYFERAGEVAAHAFLPHPLAAMPGGRHVAFRPTIDVNFAASFSAGETYLISDPAEGVIIEQSPDDKDFVMTTTMAERLASPALASCPQFVPCANPRHLAFFMTRVVLVGAGGDCGDGEVVARISSPTPRPRPRMSMVRRDFHRPGRRGRGLQ